MAYQKQQQPKPVDPKIEVKEENKKEDKRLARPGIEIELVKGEEWRDDLSGIKLYRGFYRMATKEEMEKDPKSNIALTGYVRLEKEICPTAVLPEGKDLTRVEKALRLGILKIYDPKNPTVYKEFAKDVSFRKYDKDGEMAVVDKDEAKINALLSLPLRKFEEHVSHISDEGLLIKIFNAEWDKRNPECAVRNEYIETIQKYMKTKRERLVLSPLKESEEEIIQIVPPSGMFKK